MKRTLVLLALLALAAAVATDAEAARRARVNMATVMEPIGDGAFYVEVDDGPVVLADEATPLHWSPRRGFHVDGGCCRNGEGRGGRARVSVQRFAGYDAAAGRPVYVSARGRF